MNGRRRHRRQQRRWRSRSHDRMRKRDRDGDDTDYRCEEDAKKSSKSPDDEGAFLGKPGDFIGDRDRYVIIRKAGKGTFGSVFECKDGARGRRVAIKVIRAIPRYVKSARIEAQMLDHVNLANCRDSFERRGKDAIVSTQRWFEWKGHFCIVFEMLGESVYDFIKRNKFRGFSLRDVRAIGRQLLEAMNFLHNVCHLVHTDLKLENVLFERPRSAEELPRRPPSPWRYRETDPLDSTIRTPLDQFIEPSSASVKVIDLGGATYASSAKASSIVNTRQYRSPEVILGIGWSYASDMWSLGCILYELFAGDLLFHTHDNAEHLALMRAAMGGFPKDITKKVMGDYEKYFTSDGDLRWPELALDGESAVHVEAQLPLEKLIMLDDATTPASKRAEYASFFGLLKGLLRIDQKKRLSASEALRHSFFASSTAH